MKKGFLLISVLLLSACGLTRNQTKTQPPAGTPTAKYEYSLMAAGVSLITTEAIGSIPPRTPVRVQGMRYDGQKWLYQIVTTDGRRGAEARENQLMYAPGVTPYAPTPTSPYYNASGYVFVTTEQVGEIPPDTSVGIGSSSMDENGWLYHISTQDGRTAQARVHQIRWADDITPNAPSPTSPLAGDRFITTEQVGEIPPDTRVGIGSSWFDGRRWHYQIFTEDNSQSAEATADQLRPAN